MRDREARARTPRGFLSMRYLPAAAPIPMRPSSDSSDAAVPDPLLSLAGPIGDRRVLVVAAHGLDLMCGLIRRGCRAATHLRIGDQPEAGGFDLMLLPGMAELPSLDTAVRLVRRSLAPRGRVVIGVPDARTAAALGRRLRLNGFCQLRSRHLPSGVLLRADLRKVS
jgi:hypothetical protein